MAQQRTYPPGVTSWIDIEQDDPPAARAFYAELFGWTFRQATPPQAPFQYVIAQVDGQDAAGIGGPVQPSGSPSPAGVEFYLWQAERRPGAQVTNTHGAALACHLHRGRPRRGGDDGRADRRPRAGELRRRLVPRRPAPRSPGGRVLRQQVHSAAVAPGLPGSSARTRRATLIATSSWCGGATIWAPTGRPSSRPTGAETAGCPERLKAQHRPHDS